MKDVVKVNGYVSYQSIEYGVTTGTDLETAFWIVHLPWFSPNATYIKMCLFQVHFAAIEKSYSKKVTTEFIISCGCGHLLSWCFDVCSIRGLTKTWVISIMYHYHGRLYFFVATAWWCHHLKWPYLLNWKSSYISVALLIDVTVGIT